MLDNNYCFFISEFETTVLSSRSMSEKRIAEVVILSNKAKLYNTSQGKKVDDMHIARISQGRSVKERHSSISVNYFAPVYLCILL